VPDGSNTSVGQAAAVPLQRSAASQAPVGTRQTLRAGANLSSGQRDESPVQDSATSHWPEAGRQPTPLEVKVLCQVLPS